MSSVNKVILIGNLGQDPDVRYMQSGDKVVNLSIATSERWKDKQTGEKREKTEWHRVVIFDQNIADIAVQYLKKGSKAYIEGQMQTRKWTDQSGNDRWVTEVVLQRFRGSLVLLTSQGNGPPPNTGEDTSRPTAGAAAGGTGTNPNDPLDLDDDIPF